MYTKKVLIGISADNGEENIRRMPEFLGTRYPQHGILVVSGSADWTDRITREMMQHYPNIELIVEPERRGKSTTLTAWLVKLNGGYDALVYMGADNLPQEGTIDKLLDIDSGGNVGLVGGRRIPVLREFSGNRAGRLDYGF
jgi:glycosyltransferase involved in cell wall biosynthesis